jgi:hypothetical protein
MSENCEQWGGRGIAPWTASPSLGREGVTFTNSTEAFLKGIQKSQKIHQDLPLKKDPLK